MDDFCFSGSSRSHAKEAEREEGYDERCQEISERSYLHFIILFHISFSNINVYTLITSCCCVICSFDSDAFVYIICPNSESLVLDLKFEFISFSLLPGMTDKLDFLEGDKKGKAASQDPKKAVNKKG